MKGRVLAIDMPSGRASQAALIVDGRVEDLLMDSASETTQPDIDAVSWARVDRVLPNGAGAFVQLAQDQMGFLREAKGLKAENGVLVQVIGLPEPGKAAPVTRKLLYKTRLVIHTPTAPGINVSRQIRDPEEQGRLIGIVEGWSPDPDTREPALQKYWTMHSEGGFIVRSAARNASDQDVLDAISCALGMRSNHEGLTRSSEPGKFVQARLAMDDALMEWTDPIPDMIAVTNKLASRLVPSGPWDGLALGEDIYAAIRSDEGDPFEHFGVWDEVERLQRPLVDLPSGGSMIIEATRAMVTVDVNTGDHFSQGAGMTASIEAARELPRQLRLRGLGGQVIIDFATIKKMHRKKIEEVLKTAFRKDPVPTTLAGWTPLGNFELQRKRERRPLSELL
ncbi:MAG: ribonuclease E/G [Pseudomonadota bacterium]